MCSLACLIHCFRFACVHPCLLDFMVSSLLPCFFILLLCLPMCSLACLLSCHLVSCLLMCILAYLSACLLACLFAGLLHYVFFPCHILSLFASLPACLLAYRLACFLSCLLSCLHTDLFVCSLDFLIAWQELKNDVKTSTSLQIFKKKIKTYSDSKCNCRLCKLYASQIGFLK